MKDKKSWQRIILEKLFTSLIIAIIIAVLLFFIALSKLVEIHYLSFLILRILPILSLTCIALAVLLYLESLIIGNKTKEKASQLADHLFWVGIIFSFSVVIALLLIGRI